MRLFELVRLEDATGISGTGVVAQGVEFDSGKCVMQWLTKINSTAVYDSIQDLEAIHGHGGKTVVKWRDYCVKMEFVLDKPIKAEFSKETIPNTFGGKYVTLTEEEVNNIIKQRKGE